MAELDGSAGERFAKSLQTQERRRLGTVPWRTLFCLTHWKAASSPDETRFDLTATTGTQAWQLSNAGQPPADHVLTSEEYTNACRQALCVPEPSERYEFVVQPTDARLRLEIRWRSPSLAGTATIQLDLTPVPTEQLETVMSETLGLLCDAYSSLRASVSRLDLANKRLAKQLSETQSELLRQKEESTQREEDLYIKFSLLLNTKKAKLRELESEVTQRGQEIARLETELRERPAARDDSPSDSADTDSRDNHSDTQPTLNDTTDVTQPAAAAGPSHASPPPHTDISPGQNRRKQPRLTTQPAPHQPPPPAPLFKALTTRNQPGSTADTAMQDANMDAAHGARGGAMVVDGQSDSERQDQGVLLAPSYVPQPDFDAETLPDAMEGVDIGASIGEGVYQGDTQPVDPALLAQYRPVAVANQAAGTQQGAGVQGSAQATAGLAGARGQQAAGGAGVGTSAQTGQGVVQAQGTGGAAMPVVGTVGVDEEEEIDLGL